MNRKFLLALVLLMGFSIIGIIGVQLVWMNNAVRVKNELFRLNVNEALNNTVRKLEEIQDYKIVNQFVFSDSLPQVRPAPVPPPPLSLRDMRILNPPPGHGNVVLKRKRPSVHQQRGTVINDSMRVFSYSFSTGSNPEDFVFSTNPGKINQVFVFNNDTIHHLDSLFMVNLPRLDSLVEHIEIESFIQPEVSERARQKAGNLKDMASKVITEIKSWDVIQPDKELIENILTEELSNQNIPIEFRFGILRDNRMEQPVVEADSVNLSLTSYQTNLYPNSIFRSNIKLAVYFPGRDLFILRSLNWLMIASMIFSLLVLAAFTLSIVYMLRQKKISEMKSDFINNMTHEFKTPIATISVAADSINNEKVIHDPEKIRYFTSMIRKENARMNMQVEDILTMARLDRKDFEFSWQTADVHDLIDEAIKKFSLQIEKREGLVTREFQAANPVITTDPGHAVNMIGNLLDNAIKYSELNPQIKVTTVNRNNGVLISVEDKGIGMSKYVQARIFEKFYRQTSGNIHNVKGFGLGLSYVKAVVEANRGFISVVSEPGNGSRFDLFLPFTRGKGTDTGSKTQVSEPKASEL